MADNDINDNQDPSTEPGENSNIQQVREWGKRQAARASELETAGSERDSLARENAMLRAGIDLDSPVGKMFAKAYDGELDKEAIKAGFAELGMPGTTPPPPDDNPGDQPTAEELARRQREQSLTQGSAPPGEEPQPDPYIEALRAYHDYGGNQDADAQREGLQHILNAAVAGNPAVVHTGVVDSETNARWLRERKARGAQARNMGRQSKR